VSFSKKADAWNMGKMGELGKMVSPYSMPQMVLKHQTLCQPLEFLNLPKLQKEFNEKRLKT